MKKSLLLGLSIILISGIGFFAYAGVQNEVKQVSESVECRLILESPGTSYHHLFYYNGARILTIEPKSGLEGMRLIAELSQIAKNLSEAGVCEF